jgi:hypothetical protein
MNAGDTTQGTSRTNRRRTSRARTLGAAVGRLIGFPPDPERTREPLRTAFAASGPRLAIA